jgi:hypothetical protein
MPRLVALVLSCLALGAAVACEPATIANGLLAIGGVNVGQTRTQVVATLGPPTRVVDTGEDDRLEYPGLSVWVGYEEIVYEILGTDAHRCTGGGFCPGMPFARVEAAYGAPIVAEREHGTFLEYTAAEAACWLQFAVKDGVIESVRTECQP